LYPPLINTCTTLATDKMLVPVADPGFDLRAVVGGGGVKLSTRGEALKVLTVEV